MKNLEFSRLWDNYPSTDSPCSSNGKPNFSNQCVIRVGVALSKSGVDVSKVSGVRHCWHHPTKDGHVLSAEELANGLNQVKISGLSHGKPFDPKNFKSQSAGRTGVIFFKDYWQRNRDAEG